MQKVKTHTLVTRGVSKSDRNKLKRIAKDQKNSVNSIMLHAIDSYIAMYEFELSADRMKKKEIV